MRVQLAYRWDGHRPNEVVEVDDVAGRRLISDGKARPAPEAPPRRRKKSTTDTAMPSEPDSATADTEQEAEDGR